MNLDLVAATVQIVRPQPDQGQSPGVKKGQITTHVHITDFKMGPS
jgi:hypothetical protein